MSLSALDLIDRHFALHNAIWNCYAARHSESTAMEATAALCLEQIQISPQAAVAYGRVMHGAGLPEHMGYRLSAAIKIERGEYEEAIRLAQLAEGEGWGGDWQLLVARSYLRIAFRHQQHEEFDEAIRIAKMGQAKDWGGPWRTIITKCTEKLAARYETTGEYQKAIELSRAAIQDGLSGKWERRITRCERKTLQPSWGKR